MSFIEDNHIDEMDPHEEQDDEDDEEDEVPMIHECGCGHKWSGVYRPCPICTSIRPKDASE